VVDKGSQGKQLTANAGFKAGATHFLTPEFIHIMMNLTEKPENTALS
jgi:hypothetical protein